MDDASIKAELAEALKGCHEGSVSKDALITAMALLVATKFFDCSKDEEFKMAKRVAEKPWEVIGGSREIALGVIMSLMCLLKGGVFPAYLTGNSHRWVHTLLDTAASAVVDTQSKVKTAYEVACTNTKH